MNFKELHEAIPLTRFGKLKSLEMKPYGVNSDIILAMPGRHSEDTTPKGGDYVVMVTDSKVKWKRHQFKHDDIFKDIEKKATDVSYIQMMGKDPVAILSSFMASYYAVVVTGEDPSLHVHPDYSYLPGLNPGPFMRAAQALAVAEHRRYSQHEPKGGGRYLPLRFAHGIAEARWAAEDAIKVQRYGRPAVERLEREKGRPALTEDLLTHLATLATV